MSGGALLLLGFIAPLPKGNSAEGVGTHNGKCPERVAGLLLLTRHEVSYRITEYQKQFTHHIRPIHSQAPGLVLEVRLVVSEISLAQSKCTSKSIPTSFQVQHGQRVNLLDAFSSSIHN